MARQLDARDRYSINREIFLYLDIISKGDKVGLELDYNIRVLYIYLYDLLFFNLVARYNIKIIGNYYNLRCRLSSSLFSRTPFN